MKMVFLRREETYHTPVQGSRNKCTDGFCHLYNSTVHCRSTTMVQFLGQVSSGQARGQVKVISRLQGYFDLKDYLRE